MDVKLLEAVMRHMPPIIGPRACTGIHIELAELLRESIESARETQRRQERIESLLHAQQATTGRAR